MMKRERKIIPLKDEDVEFKVRSVKVKMYLIARDSQFDIKQHAVIILRNRDNSREIIHPITQFIFENWKYKEFNTQRIHANNLVQFLNWQVQNKRKYELKTLGEIKLNHASAYLNDLTRQGKSRITVLSSQRTLTHFYHYLAKKGYLSELTLDNFKRNQISQVPSRTYIVPPFKGVILPRDRVDHIAHMIPEEFILPFLETVIQVANPIALGVYCQLFGGLRQGELVNIQRSDVTSLGAFGQEGLVIKLLKRNLRSDIIDSAGSAGMKKERNQIIFLISDWLQILWKSVV